MKTWTSLRILTLIIGVIPFYIHYYPLLSIISHEYSMNIPLSIYIYIPWPSNFHFIFMSVSFRWRATWPSRLQAGELLWRRRSGASGHVFSGFGALTIGWEFFGVPMTTHFGISVSSNMDGTWWEIPALNGFLEVFEMIFHAMFDFWRLPVLISESLIKRVLTFLCGWWWVEPSHFLMIWARPYIINYKYWWNHNLRWSLAVRH